MHSSKKMGLNNQGLLGRIFFLSRRVQAGMQQNKLQSLSSKIWKDILFVAIVEKAPR